MNQKKIIIFGCSFAPFLIVIVGTITYFASSKNNVHQNNLQLKKEKKEDLQNVNEEKKEIKSDINSPEKIEEKKEKSIKNQKVLIKNQNQEEEYIHFLDNTKIQMGLLFITNFIFFLFMLNSPKNMFKKNYQIFWLCFKIYFILKIPNNKIAFIITIIIILLINEFIFSFVYLLACWINKKPLKKAFSIYHCFWWKSWTNLFLTFIIEVFFCFINEFLAVAIKYFIGSFYYDESQKEEISRENLALKDECIF